MDKIESRLIQAVVLLDRQYMLTEHLIKKWGAALREFECAIEKKQQSLDHVLEVYNYVFALIDHLVRYQKIAFSIPKLNQKSAEYRALNEAMGELKEIRNQLQHINNDIENDYTGPLLGSICWIANQKQFIASFHDVGRQRTMPGLIFDTHTDTYIHNFCYIYNDKYHDLEKAIIGMRNFNIHINALVRIEVDGKPYDTEGHFVAASTWFQRAPIETAEPVN